MTHFLLLIRKKMLMRTNKSNLCEDADHSLTRLNGIFVSMQRLAYARTHSTNVVESWSYHSVSWLKQ